MKSIIENLRIAGCAISRKVVISVGNGVLASKCPEMLARNGGSINLSIEWARDIIKSMNWARRRAITSGKRVMNPALYEELCFTLKKKIAEIVSEHKIDRRLILNFDQTPLFTSPSIVTFAEKKSKNVPVSNRR